MVFYCDDFLTFARHNRHCILILASWLVDVCSFHYYSCTSSTHERRNRISLELTDFTSNRSRSSSSSEFSRGKRDDKMACKKRVNNNNNTSNNNNNNGWRQAPTLITLLPSQLESVGYNVARAPLSLGQFSRIKTTFWSLQVAEWKERKKASEKRSKARECSSKRSIHYIMG